MVKYKFININSVNKKKPAKFEALNSFRAPAGLGADIGGKEADTRAKALYQQLLCDETRALLAVQPGLKVCHGCSR